MPAALTGVAYRTDDRLLCQSCAIELQAEIEEGAADAELWETDPVDEGTWDLAQPPRPVSCDECGELLA